MRTTEALAMQRYGATSPAAPIRAAATAQRRPPGRQFGAACLAATACWAMGAAHGLTAAPAPAGMQLGRVDLAPLGNGSATAPPPLRSTAPLSPDPIRPPEEVGPAALRIAEPASTANVAELARLRASATQRARRGSAAEKASARASWLLGLAYLHGKGVTTDPAQARSWFERAVGLGDPLAPAGMAWCAIDGCEGPADPAAARPWIARLGRDQRALALYLEWLAQNGVAPVQVAASPLPGQGPPPDRTPHRETLVRAAQAGSVAASIELGIEDVAAGRTTEALARFRAAAPRSEAAAANAEWMSRREAAAVRTQGRQGPEGWLAAARRYHRGAGVPANFAEAIRLYQLAASEGSPEARRMLGLIYSRPAANGQIDIAWMRQLADVDVGGAMPQLGAPSSVPQLQRDPTPLYEYLPANFRK